MPRLYNIIAFLSIRLWSPVAAMMVRRHGECASSVKFDGLPYLRIGKSGRLSIGGESEIRSRAMSNIAGLSHRTIFHCEDGATIQIGRCTGISASILSAKESITIGDNVAIGPNCLIADHDYHSLDPDLRALGGETDRAGTSGAAVKIGDGVFIGTRSIILKGVTVGAGSVIGAGSVVALRNIPAGSLVAGNPARIVRSLHGSCDKADGAHQ